MSDERDDDDTACRACGLDPSPAWDTPEGRVRLCPQCAVANGVGCP